MVRVRLPLAAILLALCSLALAASSNGDNPPRGGFADFYKQQQARLLAHIDNTLAAKAEDAITGNFAFVRKINIDFQSNTGGRKGNIGVDFVGSFADAADTAFGWQLRGYKAQEDSAGANAGIFYRRIDGDNLYGINAFADYEKHEYGDFVRYSVGTGIKGKAVSFDANWYFPITDTRQVNSTLAAFSRQGYDGRLRINAPTYQKIKAAVDYYNFNREGDAERDNGFRYGIQWQPTPALRMHLFYDEGGGKFGGDIAYKWTIGEAQQWQSGGDNFAPDLFAPVLREYSQRIATVATGPAIRLDISVVGIMTTAITTEARTIRTTTTTGGMVSITRTTMAAITTTMTMTAASITTTTTMTAASVTTTTTMTTTMASRMASVHFIHTENSNTPLGPLVIRVSTLVKYLVTLPPPSQISGPVAITIRGNLHRAGVDTARVVSIIQNIFLPGSGTPHPNAPTVGEIRNFPSANGTFPVDIVEGSEDIISVVMTTETTMTMMGAITETPMTMAGAITETPMTMAAVVSETTMIIGGMTTFTTMTILPVSTTMRITTFATMTITLTTSAMGGILPFDDGGNKGGGITKPPLAIGRTDNTTMPAVNGVITNRRPAFARE